VSNAPLWTPSATRVSSTRLTAFGAHVSGRAAVDSTDYSALHQWSIEHAPEFWAEVWDFCSVTGERGALLAQGLDRMPGARFLPDARLNFAENLLRPDDDALAIIASAESTDDRHISHRDLARLVFKAARALARAGVTPGDRVAGMMANVPETIIASLGAAAIGAVWSSCSPDFGVQGVLDRFGQIEPTVFIAVDGYRYGGKRFSCTGKIAAIAAALPSVRQVVIVPFVGEPIAEEGISRSVPWSEWLDAESDTPLTCERFPFAHPLYILYSSGTTGVPKCIVHGAGGTLLQHLKEHQLHCDVRAGDRVFYFTTCGWMMWNWLVTALASRATIVLYDGAPFYPDGRCLFDLADRHGITLLGVSAKFIDAVRKAGLEPRKTHSLASIRTITSTGSPLAAESFDFVYASVKSDVHLASISGGTDIVSCFVGGNPNAPVWRGEIQVAALGMDVDVFDESGQPATDAAGELVCKAPFPSMPVAFWNDPDGAKYRAAYFERFPGVWCHGDWTRKTAHGGFIIFGRSDATLNPGGVRIGTAEIYRQVEQLPEVIESLAVGQQWQGDERIILFVRLAEGASLDDALRKKITDTIRQGTSPRHVPARIIQVADIPRTKSNKIVEIAVRHVIHGREVSNREALANPAALDLFRDLPELRR
jgi:acetoacetyl-CoA synthetase